MIREDLGYPIMITSYSQYMCTQAALNIATGERYKVVIDELIRFAQGAYGEDSGAPWMDQNLKDKLLANPRAAELAPPAGAAARGNRGRDRDRRAGQNRGRSRRGVGDAGRAAWGARVLRGLRA